MARLAPALLLLLVLQPTLAPAASVGLVADPLLSSLTPDGGLPEPLSGSLAATVGTLPLPSGATPFDLSRLDLQSDSGLRISLDDSLGSPGAGVLRSDGSIEIPTLFVTVDTGSLVFDLGLTDVLGTALFGSGGLTVQQISTSFDIDDGSGNLLAVSAVFVVPEPATAALAGLGLLLLGLRSRSRQGVPE